MTIKDNYIHNNWGPGAWADTDNANTTYVGNTITDNDGEAIIEEISYNFSITDNYLAYNGWTGGLGNPGFPTPAIYISQSGSDSDVRRGAGLPRSVMLRSKFISEPVCYQRKHLRQQRRERTSSGRIRTAICSAGFDDACTLVDGGHSGPFTMSTCKSNLPSASINTTTYASRSSGSPAQDWWDGCLWWTRKRKRHRKTPLISTRRILRTVTRPTGPIAARVAFSPNIAWPRPTTSQEAGPSLASLRSSRTISGRTMSTMARQPSTPGTRATAIIRLAGPTGPQTPRRATSAVHRASARAEPAPARSARTLGAPTAAGRSLRCQPLRPPG